jgi:thiopurine S-methyltransferase
LNKQYWSNRYIQNTTAWDLEKVSPPIKAFVDKLNNKQLNILIPGSGNGYEAEYLFLNGYLNTSVVDLAKEPLQNIKKRIVNFPEKQLIEADFFNLSKNQKFDLIIEQTFFCAINPKLREEYVKMCYGLLNKGGRIVGLLFYDIPLKEDPPFGGNKVEYLKLFEPFFEILIFEKCMNSHSSRMGKEYWIEFTKRA